MDNIAIDIQRLCKVYDTNNLIALNEVNLQIKKNIVFGLLGPNGAGKSTIINILAGLVKKTSGKINICGVDFDTFPQKIKYLLGTVPQEISLDSFFNIQDALELHAGYFGIKPDKRKTKEIIEALNLANKASSTPRMLSGGMKRRLMVAKAMVASPAVLILDEPTAGVDVELRQQLWDYIKQLKNNGTTIILTTHYLPEAEKLCDEIAFINKGQIIYNDKKDNLFATLGTKKVIIECHNPEVATNYNLNHNYLLQDNKLIINLHKQDNINQILQNIIDSGIIIKDIKTEDDDLESIYKKIYTLAI